MDGGHGSPQHNRDMQTALHDVLAAKMAAEQRIQDLTVEIECARQMLRPYVPAKTLDEALPVAL